MKDQNAKDVLSGRARDPALNGKDPRVFVIGEQPLVAETRPDALDDDTTPTDKFFIRNNGKIAPPTEDPERWTLSIDGEVNNALALTLGEIRQKFAHVTQRMMLECGGNGRAYFSPETEGVQWHHGGAGCAEWTGVRLRDVLLAAGLKETARYTGHFGSDPALDAQHPSPPISRGIPIAKAMDENTLLVFAMNGKDLLPVHGLPLRLVVPGWTGSVSHKWLTRILIRKDRHDGTLMDPWHYRVPVRVMSYGDKFDPTKFVDLESMPVRSIITSPADGARVGANFTLRGAAWAGDRSVRQVEISTDKGANWRKAALSAPKNRYDWTRFTAQVTLRPGMHELWSRATDSENNAQPEEALGWNPQGYCANPVHKIKVTVS
ncbi:MAG: sulfite oxidase [Xanthobacteraceae bacterium]|nr:sulfite oxidase [Xanthobacteraceae bacterium]